MEFTNVMFGSRAQNDQCMDAFNKHWNPYHNSIVQIEGDFLKLFAYGSSLNLFP